MSKEGWPNFPFHWIQTPNMSSLQDLASHLYEKTWTRRQRSGSGFQGESSDMEKQLIAQVIDLQQQVFVLTDTVQALLQIIDDQRASQKAKRTFKQIREKASKLGHRVWDNAIFKVLGALSTLSFIIGVLIYLFRMLKK